MKTLFFRSLLCFLILNILLPESKAQPKSRPGKVFLYKAIITTNTGYKLKGWLYDADEIQLYLVSAKTKVTSLKSLEPTITIQADQIKTIKLRRKGSIGRGILRGGLIGIGIGIGITSLINSNRSGTERFSTGQIIGVSLYIGAQFSVYSLPFALTSGKKIKLNGDYQRAKDFIRSYSVKGQLEK